MSTYIPETNKIPGVFYAWTDDGLQLPVIDITHPAFNFEVSQTDLSKLIDQMVASTQGLTQLPPAALQSMLQNSLLMRGMLVDSANTYTSGIMTYLNKLGPSNLGQGYASTLDRQWAASLTPLTFRWRMRDISRMLAESLVNAIIAHNDRDPDRYLPIHLINIAGGPAADSWNALLLIQKENPGLLAGRTLTLHVFDLDAAGPHFGENALLSLMANDAPLQALKISFQYHPYNWSKIVELKEILECIEPNCIMMGSTEGGLFEFASDEDIFDNLNILHDNTPADFRIIGPVVRDASTLDPRLVPMEQVPGRPAIRFIGLERFSLMIKPAGWMIDKKLDGPMHQVVNLVKV